MVVACDTTTEPQSLQETWDSVPFPDDGTGMPSRRLEAAAGSLGTKLVIVGGFSASMTEGLPITMDVLTYDTLTGEWGSLPPAPVAWTHANVAAVGGVVYLLGGLEGRSFVARGDVYALQTGVPDPQWKQLASMPIGEERGASAVVVSPGHIFLVGGASTDRALASILDFDLGVPEGESPWSQFPVDLPTPRSHPAAMRMYDGTMIVAGGLEDLTTTRPLGDVYAMSLAELQSPANGTNPVWELRASMPTSRGGCAYGTLYGRLVCAGGEAGLDALDVVEIYDPTLDTWETGPDPANPTLHAPMPEPRAGAHGAVVAGRLFVPGGATTLTFEPTDSMFVFSPLVP